MIPSSYNPDVLSCLANLSSDEVFTPPSLANEMLELLPEELWSNKDAKFLDPVCKSGVFLREIAKRLLKGLEKEIPDLQKRIDHIFHNQIYGVAITELTGLLARRSVYCSKKADGEYSITEFDAVQGNIIFESINHRWKNEKCEFCGASKGQYDRSSDLETHAYQLIHLSDPGDIFDMKFDVVIGNPPYQLKDGGAEQSAGPIYQKFIEQSIKLNPRYLSMIVPARFYSGGKGLDEFREKFLTDQRITEIHDFPDTSDCFPGQNIRGGICYFLWDRHHRGNARITNHKAGTVGETVERPLLEKGSEVFIRYNEAIPILRKVQKAGETSFKSLVSSRKPFGIPTNVKGGSKPFPESIKVFQNGGVGYLSKESIERNHEWISEWKVLVPYASPGDDSYPHLILSKPLIGEPPSAATETYLVVGPLKSETECQNVANYMMTSFVRFLILLIKPSQHVTNKTYAFVPMQDFSERWTDAKLYSKYGITAKEQAFIDTLIRPIQQELFS